MEGGAAYLGRTERRMLVPAEAVVTAVKMTMRPVIAEVTVREPAARREAHWMDMPVRVSTRPSSLAESILPRTEPMVASQMSASHAWCVVLLMAKTALRGKDLESMHRRFT